MEILQDLASGMLNKDIALKHNVSPSYVSKVKRGKKNFQIPLPVAPTPNMETAESTSDLIHWVKEKKKDVEQLLCFFERILNMLEEEK